VFSKFDIHYTVYAGTSFYGVSVTWEYVTLQTWTRSLAVFFRWCPIRIAMARKVCMSSNVLLK